MDISAADDLYMIIIFGILAMLGLAVAFVWFFSRAQKRLFQQEIQRQQLQLTHQDELLYSTIMAQEKERGRIAKDLHDDIGSKLNVIFLHLHRLKRHLAQAQPVDDTVTEIDELVNNTIDSSRRIAHDLLPPTLEKLGLKAALHELAEHYNHTDAFTVVLHTQESEIAELPPLVALNLFRIVQELLSNTAKYAEAEQVWIQLRGHPNAVQIKYQDDGQGFDPSDLRHQRGLGLKNLESRIRMIDGQYELHSTPGEGIRVQLQWRAQTVAPSMAAIAQR